jgi:hypothetical protein
MRVGQLRRRQVPQRMAHGLDQHRPVLPRALPSRRPARWTSRCPPGSGHPLRCARPPAYPQTRCSAARVRAAPRPCRRGRPRRRSRWRPAAPCVGTTGLDELVVATITSASSLTCAGSAIALASTPSVRMCAPDARHGPASAHESRAGARPRLPQTPRHANAPARPRRSAACGHRHGALPLPAPASDSAAVRRAVSTLPSIASSRVPVRHPSASLRPAPPATRWLRCRHARSRS